MRNSKSADLVEDDLPLLGWCSNHSTRSSFGTKTKNNTMARTKNTSSVANVPFSSAASSRFGKNVRISTHTCFLKAVARCAMQKYRAGEITEYSGDRFSSRGVKNVLVLRGKGLPAICRSRVTNFYFDEFCQEINVKTASVTIKIDSMRLKGKAVKAVHVCLRFSNNPNSKHIIRSTETTEVARVYFFYA